MTKTRLRSISLISAISLLLALLACATALAEGSHELTPDISSGKWRAFIEWYPTKFYSSGNDRLPRRQVIKAYAKEGETLYFGSSVSAAAYKQYVSREPNVPSPGTIEDIRMKLPDGSVMDYDVIRNGQGYIGVTLNAAGNRITAIQDVGPLPLVAGGYQPFSYTVPAGGEGVYEFSFFSALASDTSIRRVTADNANPWLGDPNNPADETYGERNSQMQGVAAWDVTVANGNTIIPGRVYTNYLTMTLGSNDYRNQSFLEAKVYVLTEDGYLYETDFNGINPDGFLFFGNNRGLIDLTNGNSVYHSTMYTSGAMDHPLGSIGFRLPNQPNTADNFTYEVFFNEPDAALLQYLGRAAPQPPATVTGFSFNGGAPAAPGAGGDFTFTVNKRGAFQIELQFNSDPNNIVFLANTASAGVNTVHWDGKDANGNVVQPGTYTARLRTKAGEYYFPIADAEVCRNGMQIRLMNQTAPDPYVVYYDHSRATINGDDLRHDIGEDAFTGRLKQLNGISSRKDASGVSNAMRWTTSDASFEDFYVSGNAYLHSRNSVTSNGYGNWRLFDVWTWFSNDAYLYTTPLVVRAPTPTPTPVPTPTPTPTPAPSPTPVPVPQTGDSASPGLWLALLTVAALGLAGLGLWTARKRRQS